MCRYIGAGTSLLQIYGAEQQYAWNVDLEDRKYELKEREIAAKKKAAGKAAANKMLQAKFEAEKEREKASEKMLELSIKQAEEQAKAEAMSVARNVEGFSVDNAKRLLTSANLKQMTKVKGGLEDIRVYLAKQISSTQDEYDANIEALSFALEEAKMSKDEEIGDYNMVRIGHLLSIASGYVTDKQLGDDWKVGEWFKSSPKLTKSKGLKLQSQVVPTKSKYFELRPQRQSIRTMRNQQSFYRQLRSGKN